MKKIILKRMNLAAWLTIIATYILPYRFTDGFETTFGYPVPFLSIYDIPLEKTPFMSMSVNILTIAFDMLAIYLILSIIMILWNKFRMKEKLFSKNQA